MQSNVHSKPASLGSAVFRTHTLTSRVATSIQMGTACGYYIHSARNYRKFRDSCARAAVAARVRDERRRGNRGLEGFSKSSDFQVQRLYALPSAFSLAME